jgi:hypothetical protein
MKQLLFIFLVAGALTACSKTSEPTPDAGTALAGTYQVSAYTYDSSGVVQTQALPITAGGQTIASATITSTYVSATANSLVLLIQQQGEADIKQDLGQIDLKAATQGYDLYSGTTKIGNSDGKYMNLDIPLSDPATTPLVHIVITAQKQ